MKQVIEDEKKDHIEIENKPDSPIRYHPSPTDFILDYYVTSEVKRMKRNESWDCIPKFVNKSKEGKTKTDSM